jgi:hypothetical protein
MANPRRLKHKFRNDAPREERRRKGVHDLRLDFTDRWGVVIDLTALDDRPALAYALTSALLDFCEPDGTIKRLQTFKTYENIIKCYFWQFLSAYEAQIGSHILRPQDINYFTLHSFIDWLHQKKLRGRNAYLIYLTIARIFKHLRETYPEFFDEALDIPQYPRRGVAESIIHRAPYSDREVREIELAARKDIQATILRLQCGAELLSIGRDPRSDSSWSNKENLVWYVNNELGGQYLTNQELRVAGHKKLTDVFLRLLPGSKREVYSYLYPLIPDLISPLILICLKAGFNPEPAIDLRRSCLKSVPTPGKIGIVVTKYRGGAGGANTYMRVVDDRTPLGVGRVVRAFLRFTEPCLRFLPANDRDYLWAGLQPTWGRGFQHLKDSRFISKEVRKFASRAGLIGDDGQPLKLQLSRLRTTWMTKRYRDGGNLAAISKDAKHKQVRTTEGYVNNEQTLSIHEQTIADGLYDFYDNIRGKILTQSPDSAEQIMHAAQLIETTIERAESMLRGEQDTFISTCKDFYNRPGGPTNTPCDRPWACFTCKNAYWTSQTLPRLIRFLDFIIEQRSLLTAGDWKAKFGLPYEVITKYILPAFPPKVVNDARLTSKAEQFIVSLNLKAV